MEKQPVEQMILGKQHHASASTHASFDSMSEKSINFLPPQGANNKIIGMDSRFYNNANTPQALEASRNSEVIEIDAEKGSNSTSILEKLFSGAVPLNGVGSSNIIEVSLLFPFLEFLKYFYYSGQATTAHILDSL